MDPTLIGVLGLAAFLALIMLGVPIGFSGMIVGIVGIWVLRSFPAAMSSLGTLPYSTVARYAFSVIPLFILMGHLAITAGLAEDLFAAGRKWVGRAPGGLASATVLGGAGLATVCGSSVASTAILAKAALPEMRRFSYDDRLSIGTVASVGSLAAMIPPSALIVVYGILTEQSIGQLLIAGVIPGVLTALLYIVYITIRATVNPAIGPKADRYSILEKLKAVQILWPTALLAFTVIGGIYSGLFTPTESGAVGVLGVVLIGAWKRKLGRVAVWTALVDSARTTSTVFFAMVGVLIFSSFLAHTRIPLKLGDWIGGLNVAPVVVVIALMVMYIILGTFLDALGMLVLTLPVVYPAIVALGINPIWFAILLVKTAEIGMVTPPVGLNLFVISSVDPTVPFATIMRGVGPFVGVDMAVIAMIIAVPGIALWLPNLM